MNKRLYSVVLLFSFFFCSGGFLVAHGERPDYPSGVYVYLADGSYRYGSYWAPATPYLGNSGGGFYSSSNSPTTGTVSFLRLQYRDPDYSSQLVLQKGGTYLFSVSCAAYFSNEYGSHLLTSPPSKIVFCDTEFSSSSVGQTVGDFRVISWLYDSATHVLLFEFEALEDRICERLDYYNSWYSNPSEFVMDFSGVLSFTNSAVGTKYGVASCFWALTSNVPADGGTVGAIEDQTTILIGSIDNSTQIISTAITNQTTTITNQISDSTSILKGAVEQAGQQITDKVGQAASDITGKVDETGQAIQDKIDEQYDIVDASQVGEAAQGFADQAAESLGVVSYVDTLFSGLSGLVTAGSTTLTFPAFAIAVQGTDYQVWQEHTFDLSQLDGWFSGLMAAVRLATSVVVVGAVIHYLQSVYKDVIG